MAFSGYRNTCCHNTALIITTYFYRLYLQKRNFGRAQYRLPDDSLQGPKHVGVTVKKCFNVNFNINILYVKQKVHLLVKES